MRPFLLIVSATIVGCATVHPSPRQEASIERLTPGSALLTPPSLADDAERLRVMIRRPSDSVERTMSEKTWDLHAVAGAPDQVTVTSTWPAPYSSLDTLVIERKGLAPVREWLSYRGVTRDYQFLGNRVRGTVQRADSAPRAIDLIFPQDVFAFSEVELLVRSVPLTSSRTMVVPLFSENDAAVEYDSLTVVGRDPSAGSDARWVVRFADPAIVTRYLLDGRTRAIIGAETTQRRSGTRLRYVAVASQANTGR